MSVLLQQFLIDSAGRYPETLAVDDGCVRLSYRELAARVELFCHALVQHGLEPGQRLVVLSTNSADYMAMYFACAQLNLVIVPINAHLKPAEVAWIIDDCKPSAVLTELQYRQNMTSALALTKQKAVQCFVFAVGDKTLPDGWVSLHAYCADLQPAAAATSQAALPQAHQEPVIQMYTSGTTGRPKGVLLSHENMSSLVLAWLEEMPLVSTQSRFMQATPLFHVGGLLVCLATIAAGATLYLLPKFDPELARDVLVEKSITDTLMVPAMIQRVLALPGIDQLSFASLSTLVYGASLMPSAVLRQARKVFSCRFLQGYGLTETSGVALCLRPDDHDFSVAGAVRLTAAGKAISCCEVRVADSAGRVVPVGEIGELIVRGSNVMLGYWDNPQATADTVQDNWLRTGDLGRQDSEGYFYVVGRLKDMIDFSGENVYPAEVENLLADHPLVTEVAVIGLPHPETGEAVVAVVVTNEANLELVAEQLGDYCRQHLADFKCPTRYVEIGELPRTPAGKVQKHLLKAQLLQ